MWCQQTPLLGKHKLRSQALVGDFRQPPSIHNIGTYPPQNGHAGCDMPHRFKRMNDHIVVNPAVRGHARQLTKKISRPDLLGTFLQKCGGQKLSNENRCAWEEH